MAHDRRRQSAGIHPCFPRNVAIIHPLSGQEIEGVEKEPCNLTMLIKKSRYGSIVAYRKPDGLLRAAYDPFGGFCDVCKGSGTGPMEWCGRPGAKDNTALASSEKTGISATGLWRISGRRSPCWSWEAATFCRLCCAMRCRPRVIMLIEPSTVSRQAGISCLPSPLWRRRGPWPVLECRLAQPGAAGHPWGESRNEIASYSSSRVRRRETEVISDGLGRRRR